MALLASRFLSRFVKSNPSQICSVYLCTEADKPTKKKKKPPEVRINLIEEKNSVVMSMESATKLANRRGVLLTRIDNPENWMLSGNREAFQLISPGKKMSPKKASDSKSLGFKGLKQVLFNSKIQKHDIDLKIRQITRWLKSGYVVEVAIEVGDQKDYILSTIEKNAENLAQFPGTFKRNSATFVRVEYKPLTPPGEKKEQPEDDGTSQ